jgi:hypothetical protein
MRNGMSRDASLLVKIWGVVSVLLLAGSFCVKDTTWEQVLRVVGKASNVYA